MVIGDYWGGILVKKDQECRNIRGEILSNKVKRYNLRIYLHREKINVKCRYWHQDERIQIMSGDVSDRKRLVAIKKGNLKFKLIYPKDNR